MRAIEAENPDLKDVLPKAYNRFENALLNSLLKAMNSVPMDIEGDAFGKIYEFQAMIDAYNAGSLNAEELFQQLVAFAQSLNEEEQRGVGEQLSEEELALFDLLTKPQIAMSDADREKVKATARELLATLKGGQAGARLAQTATGPGRSARHHRKAPG